MTYTAEEVRAQFEAELPPRNQTTDAWLGYQAALRSKAVAGLVEAAKRANVLARLLTVRQVIEAGNEAVEAAGLNPWCINEGQADGSEGIDCWWLDAALANFTGDNP